MKTRKLRATLAAAGVAAASLLATVNPAGATPPANTGADDLPDVVVGGGSDTTYLLSGDLTLLYNRAPGCPIITSTASVDKGKCQVAADPAVVNPGGIYGNWDHDAFVEATPTGSSAGVNALLSTGGTYNPAIDYARSSRGPSGTELNETTFWGYAQDGIALYSMGSRLGANFLSGLDIYKIYNCEYTDWSQIPGYAGSAGPIFPYGINPSSGTFGSFETYMRSVSGNATFNPNAQPCVRKVAGADGLNGTADDVFAFENDLKIQLNDKGPDNVDGNADDNDSSKFTWGSASVQFFPFLLGSGTPWTIGNVAPDPGAIFGLSYPISRTVNHVTRNVDADCRQAAGTAGTCDNVGNAVYGADTAKRGAVRDFTQFLCRVNNAAHLTNPVTGLGYKTEINGIISRNGFTQVPTSLRTPGYACRVQT